MTTKLEKPLKRELIINDEPYVVLLTPDGIKLTQKGKRKGLELAWKDIIGGDAALAAALKASVEQPT